MSDSMSNDENFLANLLVDPDKPQLVTTEITTTQEKDRMIK